MNLVVVPKEPLVIPSHLCSVMTGVACLLHVEQLPAGDTTSVTAQIQESRAVAGKTARCALNFER